MKKENVGVGYEALFGETVFEFSINFYCYHYCNTYCTIIDLFIEPACNLKKERYCITTLLARRTVQYKYSTSKLFMMF